jgi:hypothetical protein
VGAANWFAAYSKTFEGAKRLSKESNDRQAIVSAAFCDLFMAGNAIEALTQAGFAENDLELVGVLDGQFPTLKGFCCHMGMPAEHASYYEGCFEDGGALLVVRTHQRTDSQAALALLRLCGGIFPPTIN